MLALYRVPQNELNGLEMVLFPDYVERERRSTPKKNYSGSDDFLRLNRVGSIEHCDLSFPVSTVDYLWLT